MPPGIYSPASVVPRLPRRGDAGRPGADPDVPTARADAAETQGCRLRRHFVSHTHSAYTQYFLEILRVMDEHYFRHAAFAFRVRRGAAFLREFLPRGNGYPLI